MMKLSEHTLAIALVLSGLVHSSLMLGYFNQNPSVQLPLAETNALHLELLSRPDSLHQPQAEKTEKAETRQVAEIRSTTDKVPVAQSAQRMTEELPAEESGLAEHRVEVAEVSHNREMPLSQTSENENRLVQLVYQAINRHKRYPYMARRLGQQGRVTLNFVMHPDGQVTDVIVMGSSHYAVLDRAAQEAVVAISPFAMAAEYLNYEKVFDVAVDFQLN